LALLGTLLNLHSTVAPTRSFQITTCMPMLRLYSIDRGVAGLRQLVRNSPTTSTRSLTGRRCLGLGREKEYRALLVSYVNKILFQESSYLSHFAEKTPISIKHVTVRTFSQLWTPSKWRESIGDFLSISMYTTARFAVPCIRPFELTGTKTSRHIIRSRLSAHPNFSKSLSLSHRKISLQQISRWSIQTSSS
jgi:hypothetical protein